MNVTYLDPVTGGYEAIDNRLVTANATVSKANRLLLQKVGSDMAYPDQGNPLVGVTTMLTPNDIYNGITTALLPLTSNGEISLLTILQIRRTILQRWSVEIQIDLPSGESEPITWVQK